MVEATTTNSVKNIVPPTFLNTLRISGFYTANSLIIACKTAIRNKKLGLALADLLVKVIGSYSEVASRKVADQESKEA